MSLKLLSDNKACLEVPFELTESASMLLSIMVESDLRLSIALPCYPHPEKMICQQLA
jgi:hypothetical protein